jgi:phospholipase/carboxylesterase
VPIETEFITITEPGWVVRIMPSQSPAESAQPLVLIHGLTGDERSMWVFTHKLPRSYYIFAPRAPMIAEEGGYSWVDVHAGNRSRFEEYAAMADLLINRVISWVNSFKVRSHHINLIGFSQGAALCYVISVLHPDRVGKIACLSGFLPTLPENGIKPGTLNGKAFFIAHGCMDELVPVEEARTAASIIKKAGAKVIYCEDDVGHKLGLSCFNGLEQFFTTTEP